MEPGNVKIKYKTSEEYLSPCKKLRQPIGQWWWSGWVRWRHSSTSTLVEESERREPGDLRVCWPEQRWLFHQWSQLDRDSLPPWFKALMISSLYSNSWDWLLHSWCSATPPHTYNIIILTVLSPAEQLSPGHQDSPCQRKVGESKRGDPDTADTAAPALSHHCSSLNKTWWVEGKSPPSNIISWGRTKMNVWKILYFIQGYQFITKN